MSLLAVATTVGGASSSLIGGGILKVLGGHTAADVPLFGLVEVWRICFFVAGSPGIAMVLIIMTFREPDRTARNLAIEADGSYIAYIIRHWRTLVPLYLAFGLVFMFCYASANWAPTALIRTYNYSAADAGLAVGLTVGPSSIFGGLLGGLLGDWLAKQKRRYGRLRAWFGSNIPAAAGGACILTDGPHWLFLLGVMLVMGSGATLGSLSYPALYDAVPQNYRGRAVAIYMLIGSIFGIGIGTTLVAMLTEYILQNDVMVNISIGAVVIIAAILSPLLVFAQFRSYENLRTGLA